MTHRISTGPGAKRRAHGFSLIELIVAMAIVGFLAAIALPSYTSHIAKARRADARSQLLAGAQFMQRFYAANDSYLHDRGLALSSTKFPASLTRAPAQGQQYYTISIDTVATTDSAFKLVATPIGSMSSDICGSYTIDQLGQKFNIVGTKVEYIATCW